MPVEDRGTGITSIEVFMYRPKNLRGGDHPANVYVHGGGAIIMDAAMNRVYNQRKAIMERMIVFAPEFRNAPENKTPGGMYDVISTIKHVYNNGEKYGIDKGRILLSGSSGGSFLSLGASMILVRENNIHMVKAIFLNAPWLSNILEETPRDQLNPAELG